MLRFLSGILGPVFAKEMIEMARRKRYYFNRVLYGLALLFALFLAWEHFHWRFQQIGTGQIRLMAEFAYSVFVYVSVVQFGAVFVFVPLFLCGVIASEREERTLDLLFTTQLSDREIVFGKLWSRVAALVFLILCALPVMSMIMFFGGVDPDAIWRVLSATLMAILYAAGHAIYFSAITKSPMGALVRTYWWMAIWIVGVPIACAIPISAMQLRSNSLIERLFLGGLVLTNPVAPFIISVNTAEYPRMVSVVGFWFFPFSLLAPSLWASFLIWRAIGRLRLSPSPFRFLLKRAYQSLPLRIWWQTLLTNLALPRRFRVDRAWFALPVSSPLWLRARRARVYDREGYLARIQVGGWLVAFFFLAMLLIFERRDQIRNGEIAMAFLAPTWIGVAAFAALVSAAGLVGDRRRGFLDLVLMTPLQPREIVDGAMLAVWEHMQRAYWLAWALGFVFCLLGGTSALGAMCSIMTATLFCAVFCAVLVLFGVICSLTAKTMPGALLPTFIFPLVVNLGTVFLIGPFRQGTGPALWAMTGLGFAVCWIWIRRSVTAGSVGAFLICIHLALVELATFWTWSGVHGRHPEYPIAAMHPGHLAIAVLENRGREWFSYADLRWYRLLPAYWTALVVNFVVMRWWAVRHFERLADRVRIDLIPVRGKDRSMGSVQPQSDRTPYVMLDGVPSE
jgi:ABC-type transport system involved in multi-copper enzyme maturation permease subunit